tara:strand:- start:135 stop:452 length:318 start_codon:yes stop_codon:yes gene_type:complete
VLQDPLSTPTAISQIDRTCLGQPHSMAKPSALEAPDPRPFSVNNEQRAGQTAKGAPDGIQFQDHGFGSTIPINLKGENPSAGPALLHAHRCRDSISLVCSGQGLG